MDATPDLSAGVLLEHHAFVRSLARRLARDADEAAELEQDAWVAALSRAPREPERARAWLARVLRNVAWTRRRGVLRRLEHEAQAASSAPSDDPRALAERLELAQRVVAAVLELDEPHRSVVLLRHLGALDVDAIAERLGVPRETARTRLRRAHERLREKLDREHGGRDAWAPLLVGWTSSPPAEVGTVAATNMALMTGGALVGTKLAVAAVAVVVAGAVWWGASRGGEARAPSEAEMEQPLVQVPDVPIEVPPSELAGVSTVERVPVVASSAAPRPAPGWWLVGTLVGPSDDEPRAALEIRSDVQADPLTSELVARSFSIALEELLAEQPATRSVKVNVDHPDFLPAERWLELPAELALAPGERRELACDFELVAPAGIVEGEVRSIPGIVEGEFRSSPGSDEGYFVALFRRGADGVPGSEPVDSMTCDENGRYRFRIVAAGEYALVAVAPRDFGFVNLSSKEQLAPETELLTISGDGSTVQADFDLGTGASITGRIVDPSGAPLAGEHVLAQVTAGAARQLPTRFLDPLAWIDGRFERAEVRTLSQDEGRFELTGLGSVEHGIEAGPPANSAPSCEDIVRGSRGTRSATARLEVRALAPAYGIELVQHGRPILIEVSSGGEAVGEPNIELFSEDRSSSTWQLGCSHGRYAFSFSPGMRFLLRVSKPGYVARELELPPAEPLSGGVLRVELERGPAPAHLTFVVEAVVAEPGQKLLVAFLPWHVGVEEQFDLGERPPGSISRFVDVAEDGRVDIGEIEPGRWFVGARPVESPGGEFSFALPTEHVIDLAPGEDAVRPMPLDAGGQLVVFVPDGANEGLRASMRSASGEPIALRLMEQPPERTGWGSSMRVGPNTARDAFAPGDYELRLRLGGVELDPIPFAIARGEVTEVRVELGD